MEEPERAPLKGKIKHRLSTPKKPSTLQQITEDCVLKHCEPDTPFWKAGLKIQNSIRCQYYRAITLKPEKARPWTYALNCRPSGFSVTPFTQACKNPKVCPWCFCRRLLKIRDALMEPSLKIRKLHRLVVWIRRLPIKRDPPFFRADYGPHTWCNAAVTAQLVIPIYDAATAGLILRHVGFQLIPKKGMDYATNLKRSCVNPPLGSIQFNDVNRDTIHEAFKSALLLPWLDLYLMDHLEHFIQLIDLYPKKQLMRISRYNKTREPSGD
jgi:hypothetical protein